MPHIPPLAYTDSTLRTHYTGSKFRTFAFCLHQLFPSPISQGLLTHIFKNSRSSVTFSVKAFLIILSNSTTPSTPFFLLAFTIFHTIYILLIVYCLFLQKCKLHIAVFLSFCLPLECQRLVQCASYDMYSIFTE